VPQSGAASKIVLIDGTNSLYRAFFAIPGLRAPGGFPTNAAYGFVNMLTKVIREEEPDAVVVVFDARGKTFRHELYADYKAGRDAQPEDLSTQVPLVRELIEEGEITPVWLGIEFQNLTPRLRDAMEFPSNLRGVLVNRVRKKSPARRAGVKRGDVVVRVDDRPVQTARGFFEMLETTINGQELRLEIWRDGRTRKIAVRAEEIPDAVVSELVTEMLGLELELRESGGCLCTSRPSWVKPQVSLTSRPLAPMLSLWPPTGSSFRNRSSISPPAVRSTFTRRFFRDGEARRRSCAPCSRAIASPALQSCKWMRVSTPGPSSHSARSRFCQMTMLARSTIGSRRWVRK